MDKIKRNIFFFTMGLLFLCIQTHAIEISLNGQWDIVYDENNIGEKEEWYLENNFPETQKKNIHVPSSWEEYVKNYEGVAWYRKKIEISDIYKGKTIRLQFDAVNYLAGIYLNGEAIGFHEGGYDPFEFTIDDLICFGEENTLIIRVVSPVVYWADLDVDGLVKDEAPHWRGALTAGIWQDVRLKISDPIYTRGVFIESFIDGRIKLNTEIINSKPFAEETGIIYTIKEKVSGKTVWQKNESRILESGKNTFYLNAEISSPKLWSPNAPNLYKLLVSINQEEAFTEQFGIREIDMKEDGFYLNGEKFYVKAAFWEQLYPTKLAMPDSPEMVKKEISLAKEAGFNVLRFWRRPPVPYILDLADEMGIATIGAPAYESMGKKPLPVPEMPGRIAHELSSMIKRDRNHPSLIMWELFNEIKMNELKRIKHSSALLARDYDPTRIIIDESGGWTGPPKAYLPYSKEGIIINEHHLYMKAPVNQEMYNDLLHLAHADYDQKWRIPQWLDNEITPSAVSVISELGYGGMPDLESNIKDFREKGNPVTATYFAHEKLYTTLEAIMDPSGLKDIFGNIQNLCLASQQIQAEGNKQQFEAVRLNENIHGYCLHAFTGGDWVYGAGILDMWRNPKLAYYAMKEINQPFYVSARVEPANTYAGEEVRMKVHVVNEGGGRKGKFLISLFSEKGISVYSETVDLLVGSGVSEVLSNSFEIPQNSSGKYLLKVAYKEDDEEIVKNSFEMNVFQRKKPDLQDPVVVIDPDNRIKPFLDRVGVIYTERLPKKDNALYITTSNNLKSENEIKRMRLVFEKVAKGSSIIMLDPPTLYAKEFEVETGLLTPAPTKNKFYTEKIIPYDLIQQKAKGRWVPVNHGVQPHPYFDKLPGKTFMGQVYQNVSADRTILGLSQKPIVSSVSWSFNHQELAYWAIEGFWWGSDLTRLPHGDGTIIVSTLNIIGNLDTDPVADRIILNMIEYESDLLME